MGLRDIQLAELSILDHLVDDCKRLNLRYGLTSGTALGAVRHKGFIPWDDDIDIVMPRPDYEKLIVEYLNNNGRYILKTPYINDDYLYEYIKLMDSNTILIEDPDKNAIKTHVYIDIFPVDGVPSDPKKRCTHFKNVELAKNLFVARMRLKFKIKKVIGLKKWLLFLINCVISIFPKSYYVKLLDKISKKYPFETSEYAAVVIGQGEKEVLKSVDYQLNGLVEFEGKNYRSYSNIESYLDQFFGDYMKLPPVDKRIGHNFKAWSL